MESSFAVTSEISILPCFYRLYCVDLSCSSSEGMENMLLGQSLLYLTYKIKLQSNPEHRKKKKKGRLIYSIVP